eukprot:TRINITY_DN29649_c0_g2_i1.p1 TRINITY_DN29649_c0_g2~~TRINITY_DN29649_c0_g2_i1.p1  ORF type:complete len:917 (+),score=153.65 TRINITY_DN29649_c0_g2_i1:111-2861(+)
MRSSRFQVFLDHQLHNFRQRLLEAHEADFLEGSEYDGEEAELAAVPKLPLAATTQPSGPNSLEGSWHMEPVRSSFMDLSAAREALEGQAFLHGHDEHQKTFLGANVERLESCCTGSLSLLDLQEDSERQGEQMTRSEQSWESLVQQICRILDEREGARFPLHRRWSSRTSHPIPPEVKEFRDDDSESVSTASFFLMGGGRYPLVLHPSSRIRLAWFIITLAACIYDFVTAPIELAYGTPPYPVFSLLQISCGVIWTLDIGINFITAVYVNGSLRFDLRSIAIDYSRTWLAMDLTIVACEWLALMQVIESNTASIFRVFRMLRLTKLLRAWKVYQKLSEVLFHRVNVLMAYLSAIQMCMTYLGGLHVVSCVIFWMRFSFSSNMHVEDFDVAASDIFGCYLLSLEWALSLLLWSQVDAAGNNDAAIIACFRFLGLIATSIFLARTMLVVRSFVDRQSQDLLQTSANYLKTHGISNELSMKVSGCLSVYNKQTWLENKLLKETSLLEKLPKLLQVDVQEEARVPLVCELRFFCQLRHRYRACFRHICLEAMSEMAVSKHDQIFKTGYKSTQLFWVQFGAFSYVLSRKHTKLARFGSFFETDLRSRTTAVSKGAALCEISLWTDWVHTGTLCSTRGGVLLVLSASVFSKVLQGHKEACRTAVAFGRKVLSDLFQGGTDCTDLTCFREEFDDLGDWKRNDVFKGEDHLAFLSHFKKEAGTEAALMQDALLEKIRQDPEHQAGSLETPVFLDSENLEDLAELKAHVLKSHNLVLLLTPGILLRPWCLVEIVVSYQRNVNIVPVEIQRPGIKFEYPDETFFKRMGSGELLTEDDMRLLKSQDITFSELETAVRHVFTKIAVPFSPHKSSAMRAAEISSILQRCKPKRKTMRASATGTVTLDASSDYDSDTFSREFSRASSPSS